MKKVRISYTSDYAGEFGFGEISKNDLESYGFDFETYEFEEGSDFHNESHEFLESHEYGCVFFDPYVDEMFQNLDFEKIDLSKINYEIETDEKIMKGFRDSIDHYFVRFEEKNELSINFQLNVDVDDFKPELLNIKFKSLDLADGPFERFFITKISYDGVDYTEDMDDSIEERYSNRTVDVLRSDEKNGFEVIKQYN